MNEGTEVERTFARDRVSGRGSLRALRAWKAEATVTSLGGSMYYMTFVDDCTRKVWVYFPKRKSDAFDTFRRWRALVEKETGLEVKCLRSDNGGEYNSEAIKEYCADNGIQMQKTVPRTPQQNGIAERMNRTLNEHARCMRLKNEIERTEEEAEPESDEPIAENNTPLHWAENRG
ncbi:Unknown protein [Striga hermonthica]|uniref:Integrase catalytic domain-containing protein n=1 Tax=Striga hermonthica TaxID=68872 RepID=A0A9N7NA30_STRHE|nr:Unknown protein [Striga hermonthica]